MGRLPLKSFSKTRTRSLKLLPNHRFWGTAVLIIIFVIIIALFLAFQQGWFNKLEGYTSSQTSLLSNDYPDIVRKIDENIRLLKTRFPNLQSFIDIVTTLERIKSGTSISAYTELVNLQTSAKANNNVNVKYWANNGLQVIINVFPKGLLAYPTSILELQNMIYTKLNYGSMPSIAEQSSNIFQEITAKVIDVIANANGNPIISHSKILDLYTFYTKNVPNPSYIEYIVNRNTLEFMVEVSSGRAQYVAPMSPLQKYPEVQQLLEDMINKNVFTADGGIGPSLISQISKGGYISLIVKNVRVALANINKPITGHNKLVLLYAVLVEAGKASPPIYVGGSNRYSSVLDKYIFGDSGYRNDVI